MSSRRLVLAIVFACVVSGCTSIATSAAGDWLGGQYFGQIAGCGHCGGSLYGTYPYWLAHGGCEKWSCGNCGCPLGPCGPCDGGVSPHEDVVPSEGEEIPPPPAWDGQPPEPPLGSDPQAARDHGSGRLVSFEQPIVRLRPAGDNSNRRVRFQSPPSGRSVIRDINAETKAVKTITHISRPERLRREPVRIVAPNARTSGRFYR